MSKEKISRKEQLFNPNYTFKGNPSSILKNYPLRSVNLERFTTLTKNGCKDLNPKFIKDDHIYLLRGALANQETGFYSEEYANKNTIESLHLDPQGLADLHTRYGNTPFISATTDLNIAASFSNKQRIYILKMLKEHVYTFQRDFNLLESEYYIPDYIAQEEIIRSFRYDKFKQIFNFLTIEIGLDITPEDLNVTAEELECIDKDKLEMMIEFNNGADYLDPILEQLKEAEYARLKLMR